MINLIRIGYRDYVPNHRKMHIVSCIINKHTNINSEIDVTNVFSASIEYKYKILPKREALRNNLSQIFHEQQVQSTSKNDYKYTFISLFKHHLKYQIHHPK